MCPKCKARHKVQDLRCAQCHTVLAGTPVRHAEPTRIEAATTGRPSRALRALLAVALVIALGAGLWVRSLFRGANIQDSVEASSMTVPPAPAPQPTWTPPALSYPPIVGYNQGVPSSMAALAIQASPLPANAPAAEPAGMTSIAPPSEPTRKTAFTNDDLLRTRGGQGAPVVATPVASTTTSSDAPSDKAREWIDRVRDREDDVQAAQSKVRRAEAEVDARRAHALAVASDVDAHDKAQREVTDALEDLEKAERKLSEKQRDLDEAKEKAR
ncbi:MAG TPA: hypothetical protein VGQ33_03660, partial [Vicinamibacteria bacterium]|nr:hypothetical protein [Vicinamibacteria bacterium]